MGCYIVGKVECASSAALSLEIDIAFLGKRIVDFLECFSQLDMFFTKRDGDKGQGFSQAFACLHTSELLWLYRSTL